MAWLVVLGGVAGWYRTGVRGRVGTEAAMAGGSAGVGATAVGGDKGRVPKDERNPAEIRAEVRMHFM